MASRLFDASLEPRRWQKFKAAGYTGPVCGTIYRSDDFVPSSGMPLGGIGTGCVDLGATGRLGYCTLFKRVWGWDYRDRVFAVPTRGSGNHPKQNVGTATAVNDGVVRDLWPGRRGLLDLPFLGLAVDGRICVLAADGLDGVEPVRKIEYWGHYPTADVEFDTGGPVQAALRAWAPFIPGDIQSSEMPCAAFEVTLRNTTDRNCAATLAFSFPGSGSRVLSRRKRTEFGLNGIEVSTADSSYSLAAVADGVRFGGSLETGVDWSGIVSALPPMSNSGSSIAVAVPLAAYSSATVIFLLAWHTPEWQSEFPYGATQHRYTNHYALSFPSAWTAAVAMARQRKDLLSRILSWQSAVYQDESLPIWVRDQLINTLHLITEESFWAVAKPPLGEWTYQGGVFSLVESTVAAGQQSCIPCDWYGNFPLVYFFPELAKSTLRAYAVNMDPAGAVPFYLGQGLDLAGAPHGTNYAHDRQRTLNGACFADLVDRLWLTSQDDGFLHEYYPALKANAHYTFGASATGDGVLGVINAVSDEWYESMDMRGITAHAGGVRLAQLQILERMAQAVGDAEFRDKCRRWIARGQETLEEKLWDGATYLLSLDPATGKKNQLLLAYQLDGEWISRLHGLAGVFAQDRVQTCLETLKTLEHKNPQGLMINVLDRSGSLTEFGGRMGWMCSMPASVFIAGMTVIQAGDRERGLEIARRAMGQIVNRLGMTWDMPNMVRADPGDGQQPESMRIYGTDYYQCMSIWALPAVLAGSDLAAPCRPGGLVARILRAAASKAR